MDVAGLVVEEAGVDRKTYNTCYLYLVLFIFISFLLARAAGKTRVRREWGRSRLASIISTTALIEELTPMQTFFFTLSPS